MNKIILTLAALTLSTTAFAMGTVPVVVTTLDPVEVSVFPALIQAPTDAVNAHKAAGTYTPALQKAVGGYLKLVASYGAKTTAAFNARDAAAFHGHFMNLELNKQRACKVLGNCVPDGRTLYP